MKTGNIAPHSGNNCFTKLTNLVKKHYVLIVHLVFYLTLLLGLCGCLAIYSSSAMAANESKTFLLRQALWIGAGLIVMITAWKIPFRFYEKNIFYLLLIAIISILAVYWFGIRINGMKGWFSLNYMLIQPSEVVKVFYILALCKIIDSNQHNDEIWPRLAFLLTVVVFAVLLFMQPDYAMAGIYVASSLVILFLSGVKLRFIGIALLALPIGLILALNRSTYVRNRLVSFWDVENNLYQGGWHIRQFQLAIARGGSSGCKIGNSVWSNSYLPLSYNDSIFAAIAETTGFFGTLPVIILFVMLISLLYLLSLVNGRSLNALFILSSTTILAVQILLHIGVNLALLPPTGITLPLISYGGSSLLGTMLTLGIILSASNNRQ